MVREEVGGGEARGYTHIGALPCRMSEAIRGEANEEKAWQGPRHG